MYRTVVCPICSARQVAEICVVEGSPIVQCIECGLVFRQKLITGNAYNELYQNTDTMETPFYASNKEAVDPRSEPARTFSQGLDSLEALGVRGKLLDIGCSYGAFLELAKLRGWEVQGVELSRHTAAYAREKRHLEVFTGFVHEAGFPDESFDVITLWDVVEHFDDPVCSLREIHRILKPGGVIVLFTMNHNSLMNRLGRLLYTVSLRRWTHLMQLFYDIHHNFFFTFETLMALLDEVGSYTPEKVEYRPANIRRWRTVEINPLLMLGSDIVDALAKPAGTAYRILLYARKGL